ncbi:hypothetical protein L4B24_26890 [Bacillus toyonensis]|nr:MULTISPECIES: hypothetical protein [Bacillus cereus group]MCH5471025.1 hypothetical protein [Bacillus toyonensis]MCU5490769.1 hypothetical protein [Bacillus cereus]
MSCCKTFCIGKTQQSQRQPSVAPVGPVRPVGPVAPVGPVPPVGPVGRVNDVIGGSVGPIKFGFNALA